jgi:spoIIIJ-associated protein
LTVGEEDAGKMIGKHGETLTSMGHLVTLSFREALKNEDETSRRVVVDINAYKERREEEAIELGRELAQRAVEEQEPQALPRSLHPHQRRVVHQALQDFEGVYTQSEGEGRDRRLVIYPIEYQDHGDTLEGDFADQPEAADADTEVVEASGIQE